MIPKLLIHLVIVSSIVTVAEAQKIRYYDAHNNEVRSEEAYYFTVQYKINDTCWAKDYYHAKGPLIKKEEYRDQKNTLRNGRYFFYNKIGYIDSAGFFLNDKQEGVWIVYSGTGDSSLEEVYQKGTLVETKDITPYKIEDTTGAIESEFSGGREGWQRYLAKSIRVPDAVANNVSNFSGEAIVSFTVDKDGSLHDILLVKSSLYLMDDEYIQTIKKSPNWVPAQLKGAVVKSYKKQPFFCILQ